MTKEEMDKLDVFLAENVIGWEWCQLLGGWIPYENCTFGEIILKSEWCPTTNLAQAIECAEKTGLPYHINKLAIDNYFCEIGDSKSFAYENTMALAVSLACKKAWGGK